MLKIRHNAKRLRVVIKSSTAGEAFIESPFARMSERRMAEVMRKRQRFGEVLIEAQCARERTGDLHDLQRMRQARSVVIAFVINEDLRLMGETSECRRMNDSVAVAAERTTGRTLRFSMEPASALRRI